MYRSLPSPPHVLQRAAQGNQEALSTLVCARKERVCRLTFALLAGRMDAEFASPASAQCENWHLLVALYRAVFGLPADCRGVFVLTDLEGLDVEQVAWLLNLKNAEAQERLLQARTLVRLQLTTGTSRPQSDVEH